MEADTTGGHRNVKQIVTVQEPGGNVSQIFTVTQRTSSFGLQSPASPIGKIQPGVGYSLLRKDLPSTLKSRTTPSILRKGLKRNFIRIRDVHSQEQESVLKSSRVREPNAQNVVTTVQCASTSNEHSLKSLSQTNLGDVGSVKSVAYRTYVRVPSQSTDAPRVKLETHPVAVPRVCSPSVQVSKKPVVRRIFVRRSIPFAGVARSSKAQKEPPTLLTTNAIPVRRAAVESIPVRPAADESIPVRPAVDESIPLVPQASETVPTERISIAPIPIDLIKVEAPDEFTVDNSTFSSESTKSSTPVIDASNINVDPEERTPGNVYTAPDLWENPETMDDFLEDIAKNVHRTAESFYMVSHESLMEVLSTCNICASAADVDLRRKATTCEANIRCRKNARHDVFWDGEKCRGSGLKRKNRNGTNSQIPHPGDDLPWSLILLSVIAKIIDIPLRKLEYLCRLLFSADNIGAKLQAASSHAKSLPLIHGLTKPQLEKPMDHVKLIVVCRKLLVFLDPFNYSPLACFEYPGSKLLSTFDLSSALNSGLQRLQLLSSNKFSSVDVVNSNTTADDSDEWKPILVPDMDLLYQEALTSLHVALWQNKFQFDIKSSRLRAVLGDITKALCFFQPEVAKISELEGRSCYSLVLQDLQRMHDRLYVPQISEIGLLRGSLRSLTAPECRVQVETLIREIERIDVYHLFNPLYEKIISTADASYVVSIRNEEPCRATHKVMKMIEMCQEQDLSLENALRVLLLLPVKSTPMDVIENICGIR